MREITGPPAVVQADADLTAIAERIRGRLRRGAQDVIDTGRDLIEAKRRLGHGNYLPWLEEEFGWSESTALRFVRVAEAFGSVNLTDLTVAPSALYLLAAPSTPDEAREEALSRAGRGEAITHAVALQLLPTPDATRVPRRAAGNGPRCRVPALPVTAQGERFRVETSDALAWLAAQPADSIDLVLGSPPYEDARLYLEGGADVGIARGRDEWVAWMVDVFLASLRVCKGLVAFVVSGRTKDYRWSASPALLMAALDGRGVNLRCPPLYARVGIPGSGGPDWLRADYEFVVCATRGGPLPWSNNVAMGQPPKYRPGGEPSHRRQDGSRVNGGGYATPEERADVGPHRARAQAGAVYVPPELANPGNVIDCDDGAAEGGLGSGLIRCKVGGGNMGDPLCHENEAPFPEALAEFFVRSFAPPGGVVADPFSGSGTTGKMALAFGRRFVGCDLRPSQVELTRQRLALVEPPA